MTTALIDADVLAYQAAAAGEKPVDWGDGLWTLHSFEDDVLATFEDKLATILATVGAKDYILAFTAPNNFRYSVLPTYKGNRADKRKPMLLNWIRAHAMDTHPSYLKEGLEGDDCLGILSTCGRYTNPIICSIDKDFKTIPGKFYDFGKEITYDISEQEADWWHMYQTLVGDATDGYKGCPGVGDVGARKVLDGEGPLWPKVVAAFTKAKLGEEAALIQARVARICRSTDYDYNTKEVILWNPLVTTKSPQGESLDVKK
jgi:DNA polymerase-1